MPDLYVVRELEGYRQISPPPSRALPGLSVIVLDSRLNYRRVREYKSEEADRRVFGRIPSREEARAWAREQAAELAARLNEANP